MPQFCPNCKGIIYLKKGRNNRKQSYCFKCGPLDVEIDPERYKIKSDLGEQHETVVIDRAKQLEEFKKQYGEKTWGASCPKCKSFYLTKHLMVTRGDEAGKTFWLCFNCGLSFRRPIHVPRKGKDLSITDSNKLH